MSDESQIRTAARLIFLWGLSVSVLVICLGFFWRSAPGFVVITVLWLVLVLPLMVHTARWLGSRHRV